MEENKHSWMNSIGAIGGVVGVLIVGIWQLGQRDATIGENGRAIQNNAAAIAENKREIKDGFAAIQESLKELRETQTNEDIAVLKTKLDHMEGQLKDHDHNGTYAGKDHTHAAPTAQQ